MELEPPDWHHLRAARGWMQLGNHVEAGEELARIAPENLTHPDVLDMRWAVCAQGGSWAAAAEIAETMVSVAPDRVEGWVNRAYAARRKPGGGLELAETLLLPALAKFPGISIVPYNLACYSAQLGRLDEAIGRLALAMSTVRERDSLRQQALADSDLAPVWERIRTM